MNRLDSDRIVADLANGRGRRALGGVGRRVLGAVAGVSTDEPVVHLTFDDGPDPDVTPRILEMLDERDISASFFVTLDRAERNPGLVHAALERNHVVGLHSRTHPHLPELGLRGILDEIWRAKSGLERITGQPVRWFRPPYGDQDLRSLAITGFARMKVLLWTAEFSDWLAEPIDELLRIGEPRLLPGRILLLHDTTPSGVGDPSFKPDLVESLLTRTERRGLEFVSLRTLLGKGAPVRRVSLRRVGRRPKLRRG